MVEPRITAPTLFTEMLEVETIDLHEKDCTITMAEDTVTKVNIIKEMPKQETLCLLHMLCTRKV